MSEIADSSERNSEISSVSPFPRFVKQLVFLPFVQYPVLPRTPDLSNPQSFGLSNTVHQKIRLKSSKSKETLGSWHMKPLKQSARDSARVVLYLHGNAHNRAQSHRVALYKLLQEDGYHIFTIDYRGYGDSSPVELSETSVVEDARAALDWIHKTWNNKAKIFVLGHSLGAAIATHMVSRLHQQIENSPSKAENYAAEIPESCSSTSENSPSTSENSPSTPSTPENTPSTSENSPSTAENSPSTPSTPENTPSTSENSPSTSSPHICGLILQSPFNKMLDEVQTFSAAKALSSVGVNVKEKLRKGDVVFDSESWLPRVRCPVVIFHAEDDNVIPYRLGKQLFEKAKEGGKEDVTFVTIEKELGCGHKNLYKSKQFIKQLNQFMDEHS